MKKIILVLISLFLVFSVALMTNLINVESEEDLLNENNFLIIAHRGANEYAPEHTLVAYRMAAEMGADYIEIDLRMTKDGRLIAFHDYTVDRTTNGSGFVRDHTLKQLKELDAGSWFNEQFPEKANDKFKGLTIPTLEEIFDEFGNEVNYYIETKKPDPNLSMEKKLLSLLEEYDLLKDKHLSNGKIIIQSFNKDSLKAIHDMNPDIPLIQMRKFKQDASISKKEIEGTKKYAVGLGLNVGSLNDDYIKKVKDAGLLLHTYTVNEPKDIQALRSKGVTGVFTDYLVDALEVINQTDQKKAE